MAPCTVRALGVRLTFSQTEYTNNQGKVKRNEEKHTKYQQEFKSADQDQRDDA